MDVDELLVHAMRDGMAGFVIGSGRVVTREAMMAQHIEQLEYEVEKSKSRIATRLHEAGYGLIKSVK